MASRSRLSFTLVEMLVAIAVLSLLLLVIFSIVGSSLTLSDSTSRKADTSIEARQILDRIGADIDGMLIRPDVDQFYTNGPASSFENDKMFFYSQQTGFFNSDPAGMNGISPTNQSPVSLIGYRISTNDTPSPHPPVLERLARGLTADLGVDPIDQSEDPLDPNGTTAPLVYLTFPARTSTATSTTASATNFPAAPAGAITSVWGGTTEKATYHIGATYTSPTKGDVGTSAGNFDDGVSPYYDAIGPDVFRFEICFLLQNGTYSLYPGYTNSAPVYSSTSSFGLTNTVAIVVAIAILDAKSRKLVPAASWNKLIAALPNPPATAAGVVAANSLMDTTWNAALNGSTFASSAGIPALAASHIRVYQRYYYLNTPKAQ